MDAKTVSYDSILWQQLKQEVHNSLAGKPRKVTGLYFKMLGIFGLWLVSYFTYLATANTGRPLYIVPAVIGLFLTSTTLSFNFIHEGSHRALTTSKCLNTCIQILAACVYGISTLNWHEKHIVRHHVYTNVHAMDFDINSKGLFRYSPHDQWKIWHSWQAYYVIPLYCLTVFKWIYFTDFRDLFLNIYALSYRKRLVIAGEILLTRLVHIVLFILIPAYHFSSFAACIGYYLLFIGLSGLTTAIIFQLAHVHADLVFYTQTHPVITQKLKHQLSSTANFAAQNAWLTFFTGGLNMQIVHHLFPHISHVDYPTIEPIIRSFCIKKNLPYFSYPSILAAMQAHFSYLKTLSVKPKSFLYRP